MREYKYHHRIYWLIIVDIDDLLTWWPKVSERSRFSNLVTVIRIWPEPVKIYTESPYLPTLLRIWLYRSGCLGLVVPVEKPTVSQIWRGEVKKKIKYIYNWLQRFLIFWGNNWKIHPWWLASQKFMQNQTIDGLVWFCMNFAKSGLIRTEITGHFQALTIIKHLISLFEFLFCFVEFFVYSIFFNKSN